MHFFLSLRSLTINVLVMADVNCERMVLLFLQEAFDLERSFLGNIDLTIEAGKMVGLPRLELGTYRL